MSSPDVVSLIKNSNDKVPREALSTTCMKDEVEPVNTPVPISPDKSSECPDKKIIKISDIGVEREKEHCGYPIYAVGELAEKGEASDVLEFATIHELTEDIKETIKVKIANRVCNYNIKDNSSDFDLVKERIVIHDDFPFDSGKPKMPIGMVQFDIFSSEALDIGKIMMGLLEKSNSDLVRYPRKPGPIQAVLQAHSSGGKIHTDIRFQFNNHLLGWGLFNQKSSYRIPEDLTVQRLKQDIGNFSVKGGKVLKSITSPNIVSSPKKKHPTAWLKIGDSVIDEKKNEIIVTLDNNVKIEYGIQTRDFHEYWVMSPKTDLKGRLLFRRIASDGKGSTPKGQTVWLGNFTTKLEPTVLTPSAIKNGTMPELGFSGLPTSVEKDIPKEYRYWQADNKADASRQRKELKDSGILRGSQIRVANNKFRIVHSKNYLGVNTTVCKSDVVLDFRLMKQTWDKSRRHNFYLCVNDSYAQKQYFWKSATLPYEQVTVMEKENYNADTAKYLYHGSQLECKSALNDSHSRKSSIELVDSGNVFLKDAYSEGYSFEFRGKNLIGEFSLTQEEEGSKYWVMTKAISNDTLPKQENIGEYFYLKQPITQKNRLDRPVMFDLNRKTICKTIKEVEPFLSDPISSDGVYLRKRYSNSGIVQFINEKPYACLVKDSGHWVIENNQLLDAISLLSNKLGDFVAECDFCFYFKDTKDFAPNSEVLKSQGGDLSNFDIEIVLTNLCGKEGFLQVDKDLGFLQSNFASIDQFLSDNNVTMIKTSSFHKIDGGAGINKMFKQHMASLLIEDCYTEIIVAKCQGFGVSDCKGDASLVFDPYRELNVIVMDKKAATKKSLKKIGRDCDGRVYVTYKCGIEIDNEYRIDPKHIFYKKNKKYIEIGETLPTLINVDVGDTLLVKSSGLNYKKTSKIGIFEWNNAIPSDKLNTDCYGVDQIVPLLNSEEINKSIKSIVPDRVPVWKSQKEERYVLGIVLVPEEVDGHDEVYSHEEVRNNAFNFMRFYQEIGLYHTQPNRGRVALVESYVAPVDMQIDGRFISAGTWLIGLKILSEDIWEKVKSGELTGLSIFGYAKRSLEKG